MSKRDPRSDEISRSTYVQTKAHPKEVLDDQEVVRRNGPRTDLDLITSPGDPDTAVEVSTSPGDPRENLKTQPENKKTFL